MTQEEKYEKFPNLLELKKECETAKRNTKEYWILRCKYLEKTLDETYSLFERNNCREFYTILRNRE